MSAKYNVESTYIEEQSVIPSPLFAAPRLPQLPAAVPHLGNLPLPDHPYQDKFLLGTWPVFVFVLQSCHRYGRLFRKLLEKLQRYAPTKGNQELS